jgi:hypothetical protein
MSSKAIVVIDNFYDNPDEIRELATQLVYTKKDNAVYPGAEAYSDKYDWETVKAKIRKHIDEDVDYPCPKNPSFQQGKFRVAVASDQKERPDLVHEDLQRWGGVVYLTLPKYCQGGVAFYRHKATGALNSTPEWFKNVFPNLSALPKEERIKIILAEFKDPTKWEMTGQIPMQFNRVVILMAKCFHGSTGIFGKNIEDGRLTQHFEFYSIND